MLFREKDTGLKNYMQEMYADCIDFEGTFVPKITVGYYLRYQKQYTIEEISDTISDVFLKLMELEKKGILRNKLDHLHIVEDTLPAIELERKKLGIYISGYIRKVLQNKRMLPEIPASGSDGSDTPQTKTQMIYMHAPVEQDTEAIIEENALELPSEKEIVQILKLVSAADKVKRQRGYKLLNVILRLPDMESLLEDKMKEDAEYYRSFKEQYSKNGARPVDLALFPLTIDWEKETEFCHMAKRLGASGNRSFMSLVAKLCKYVRQDPKRIYELAVKHHIVAEL